MDNYGVGVRDFLHSFDTVKHILADDIEPRQHGNGFFQLDLYNGYRLHVWDPDYPIAQKVPTPIHDHRFTFESLVLYGVQKHVTYKMEFDSKYPTHQIYEARPRIQEDTGLYATERYVSVGDRHVRTIPAGKSYVFGNKLFHETPNDSYVVTLLKKIEVDYNHLPRVLCPVGYEPDNEFTRYDLPSDERWRVIEKAINLVLEI